MQGLFIQGKRPTSKKQVRECATGEHPERVRIEATSPIMGAAEYDGPITGMRRGEEITCVGPDPFTKRTFYLTITRKSDGSFRVS